jgi:uncharacterized protein (DUF2342 family)
MRLRSLALGGRIIARVLLLVRDMLLSISESTMTWISPGAIQGCDLRWACPREALSLPGFKARPWLVTVQADGRIRFHARVVASKGRVRK